MDSDEFEEYKTDAIMLGSDYEADVYTMLDSYQLIVEIISDRLKLYPTSIRDDMSALAKTSNPRIKACIGIQVAEKRLLLELRAQLLEEINQLEEEAENKEEEKPPKKKKENSNTNKK